MSATTHYEVRHVRFNGSSIGLTEGLGEVNGSVMTYVSERGARGGLKRMRKNDELPKDGRQAVFKIITEELPEKPVVPLPEGHDGSQTNGQ